MSDWNGSLDVVIRPLSHLKIPEFANYESGSWGYAHAGAAALGHATYETCLAAGVMVTALVLLHKADDEMFHTLHGLALSLALNAGYARTARAAATGDDCCCACCRICCQVLQAPVQPTVSYSVPSCIEHVVATEWRTFRCKACITRTG